jgi:hypothetical protein
MARRMLENATAPPPSIPKGCAVPRRDAEHLACALQGVGVKLCRKKHNKHKRATCERAAHKAYGAKATAKKSTRRGTR